MKYLTLTVAVLAIACSSGSGSGGGSGGMAGSGTGGTGTGGTGTGGTGTGGTSSTASCVGYCGSSQPVPGSSPSCYCDDYCTTAGDCCGDKATACP